MPEILHQVHIKGTPSDVYRAVATRDGLAGWWTRDVRGEPAVGAVLEFGFNGRRTNFLMEVAKLEPESHVHWKCIGGHHEWANTEVDFIVQADEAGTILRLHHTRWLWRDGLLAMASFDWARYLMSLQALVETGTGAPHEG